MTIDKNGGACRPDKGRISQAKDQMLRTASVAALGVAASLVGATSGWAQTVSSSSEPNTLDEVMVTGTRVVRDGYQAPTPLTVVGAEQLKQAAPENLADFVNVLPALAGSSTPQNQQKGLSGLNTLNLRNIGSTRTLVLLDGQRSVGALLTGQVDINNIPQALVSRIDVVTGGASAAYGSDAVAGVVNFVLDKTFTGAKGELSGGLSNEGDDRSWRATVTLGSRFADGRGHLILSGEVSEREGVATNTRKWNQAGWKVINNPGYTPTNGQPRMLVLRGVGLSNASPGGIITAGPLKGIEFGPGGTPRQFNYGAIVSDPYMQGGDWVSTNADALSSLDGELNRQSVFFRSSYDVSETLNVFVQTSWDYTYGKNFVQPQSNLGNIVVRADNPFIPASVATQMAARGLASLTLGTMNGDIGIIQLADPHTTNRYVIGASGEFGAFGSTWSWDGYGQVGMTRFSYNGLNVTRKSAFALALDAVRAPNGSIVCRSTLTDPTNGCVPYNAMGVGVNSPAAIQYLTGVHSHRNETYEQDVAAFNVRGEPLSTWAGPVSLAMGAEHRRESVSGTATPDDLANNFFVGNFLPNHGHYSVTEGYLEAVAPLAADKSWAKSLDFNGAIRATNYSTSGYVTTWKAGFSYAPTDDIRFRLTQSRDIRAPNLAELFQSGLVTTNMVTDPFNNNQSVQYQAISTGNLALKPEKADTTGLGVVFSPSFLPGFGASVDYYSIKINDAIGSIGAQQILNFCFQGNEAFCSAITRGVGAGGGNVITSIRTQPFNFVTQVSKGLDIETSYAVPLDTIVESWDGRLSLRLLATRYLKSYSDNGVSPVVNSVGSNAGNGPPKWRYVATANYDRGPFGLTLTARGVSSGTYSNAWIACASACPTSTLDNPTVNANHIAGAVFVDANLSFKFGGADSSAAEAFLNIKNLMNKDPVVVAQGPSGASVVAPAANPTLYDTLGRVFRIGVRFRM